jgi:hypothetical protein
MKHYGIADAHGLESFRPVTFNPDIEGFEVDTRELSMMVLRANANRDRHSVVYHADIPVQSCREITALMKDGQNDAALLKLKSDATSIKLAKSPGAEKSWNLIPNPDLDPYS